MVTMYFEVEDIKKGPKHLVNMLNEIPHEDIATTSEALCAIVAFEKEARKNYIEKGEWI